MCAAGIPVYLHYCGGELEKVNYVLKSKGCCGSEGEDESSDDGCCHDEQLVLKNAPDFTIKAFHNYELVNTYCSLFYVSLPFSIPVVPVVQTIPLKADSPPPDQPQQVLISTSVLRI